MGQHRFTIVQIVVDFITQSGFESTSDQAIKPVLRGCSSANKTHLFWGSWASDRNRSKVVFGSGIVKVAAIHLHSYTDEVHLETYVMNENIIRWVFAIQEKPFE